MQFTFSIFCIYIITEILEKVKFLVFRADLYALCRLSYPTNRVGVGLEPTTSVLPGQIKIC